MCIVVDQHEETNGEPTTLAAALKYARHGLPVVRIWEREKKPVENAWQNHATTDEQTITYLWTGDPRCNVGVQMGCGQQPIIDIECDSDEAEEEYDALWDGKPPVVPSYRGRRGRHYLFRWRPGFPDKAAFHCGAIEVRTGNGGKGAQSVFPPSVHPSGAVYSWEPGLSLDDVPLGTLPDEIVAKLVVDVTTSTATVDHREVVPVQVDQDEATEQARHWLSNIPGTQSGMGMECDRRVSRIAVLLVHGFALDEETAVDLLTAWGQRDDQIDAHGMPYPWTEKEMIRKVTWAVGQTYEGTTGDKVRLTGHELDAAVEAVIQPAPATVDGRQEAPMGQVSGNNALSATTTVPVVPMPSNGRTTDFIEEIAQAEAQLAKNKTEKLPAWTRGISAADLDAEEIEVTYLVDRLLAAMPTVIGGRFKTLKTLIMTDLLVSMSSGTKFLGKWECRQVKVGVWSGESGRPALQNAMRRICASKGIKPRECELEWHFDLPPLYSPKDLDIMAKLIPVRGYKAIFIDPAYLCLLDSNTATRAGNVFVMGAALQPLTAVGQQTGCLLGLVHHFGKWTDSNSHVPAELGELSQSGLAEWSRQWLLLSRRAAYQHDGKHQLFLTAGGSLGQSYQLAVNVDEGGMDDQGHFRTKWRVNVKQLVQAQTDDKIARKDRKASEIGEKVLAALKDRSPMTKRAIGEETGLRQDKSLDAVLAELTKEGKVVDTKCKAKNGQEYNAYRLA